MKRWWFVTSRLYWRIEHAYIVIQLMRSLWIIWYAQTLSVAAIFCKGFPSLKTFNRIMCAPICHITTLDTCCVCVVVSKCQYKCVWVFTQDDLSKWDALNVGKESWLDCSHFGSYSLIDTIPLQNIPKFVCQAVGQQQDKSWSRRQHCWQYQRNVNIKWIRKTVCTLHLAMKWCAFRQIYEPQRLNTPAKQTWK